MNRRSLQLVTSLFLGATLLFAAESSAELSNAQRAQPHVDAGQAAFNEGDYETAIREWTAARELVEEPMLLYNIGLSHERLENLREAIDAYNAYVREAPDADNTPEVRVRIEELHSERVEARDADLDVGAADEQETEAQRDEARFHGNLIRAHHELDVVLGTNVSLAPGIRGGGGSASFSLEFDYYYRINPTWSVGIGGLFDNFFTADEIESGANQKHYGGLISGRWATRFVNERLEIRATAAIGYEFVQTSGYGHGEDFHWVFTRIGGAVAYAIYHGFGVVLRLGFRLGFIPGGVQAVAGVTDEQNFGGTFETTLGVFWAF